MNHEVLATRFVHRDDLANLLVRLRGFVEETGRADSIHARFHA